MIINKNQGPCIGLFQINHLIVYSKKIISIKTFNSEFQANEVWFTDQNSQPCETEDKINLILVIK